MNLTYTSVIRKIITIKSMNHEQAFLLQVSIQNTLIKTLVATNCNEKGQVDPDVERPFYLCDIFSIDLDMHIYKWQE